MITLVVPRHPQIYQDLVDNRDAAFYIVEMTARNLDTHQCIHVKVDGIRYTIRWYYSLRNLGTKEWQLCKMSISFTFSH